MRLWFSVLTHLCRIRFCANSDVGISTIADVLEKPFDIVLNLGYSESTWKNPGFKVMPDNLSVTDGLVVRNSGEWAKRKHHYLNEILRDHDRLHAE